MRLDVFNSVAAAEKNIKDSGKLKQLSPEEQRLVEKIVRIDGAVSRRILIYEGPGWETCRPGPLRRQTKSSHGIEERAFPSLLGVQREHRYLVQRHNADWRQKNFNEENGTITFTEEELTGVPKDVISGYTQREVDGKTVYESTFKTPDIFPIVRHLARNFCPS